MPDKHKAIELADWADWFCRNVNDPQDFRWKHLADMATELRRLHAENQVLRHLCERACLALQEDDFPSLRQQLRIATKEEDHYV